MELLKCAVMDVLSCQRSVGRERLNTLGCSEPQPWTVNWGETTVCWAGVTVFMVTRLPAPGSYITLSVHTGEKKRFPFTCGKKQKAITRQVFGLIKVIRAAGGNIMSSFQRGAVKMWCYWWVKYTHTLTHVHVRTHNNRVSIECDSPRLNGTCGAICRTKTEAGLLLQIYRGGFHLWYHSSTQLIIKWHPSRKEITTLQ